MAVAFPHGDVHMLASTPGLRPMEITTEAVTQLTRPDSIARVKYGGGGSNTRLICGFFACDSAVSQPLIERLPQLMKCPAGEPGTSALLPVHKGGSGKDAPPGTGAFLGKLAELMFIEGVQSYFAALSATEGWIAGFRDPYVSHALGLMYGRPGAEWTLLSLARQVGISRSALADRFVRCTGMAPMQCLAQWRLRRAADALTQTETAIKVIAEAAGYASTPAFTRAFKREFSCSPAAWRRSSHAAAGDGAG
jgi:AraC-like DNA-binding protein